MGADYHFSVTKLPNLATHHLYGQSPGHKKKKKDPIQLCINQPPSLITESSSMPSDGLVSAAAQTACSQISSLYLFYCCQTSQLNHKEKQYQNYKKLNAH